MFPVVADSAPVTAPVLPEFPVFPLPAVPVTLGLLIAAPVSPPVAVEDVVVEPVLPEVADPVALLVAAPESPPVAEPVAAPELPVTEVIVTAPEPPPSVLPECPDASALPVRPDVGNAVALPAAPERANEMGAVRTSPLLPESPPVALESVRLEPLRARPMAEPSVVASPESPLVPALPEW